MKSNSLLLPAGLALFLFFPAFLRAQSDNFILSKNEFAPGKESVPIQVTVSHFPDNLSLRVYNSVGELVKILDQVNPTGPSTKPIPRMEPTSIMGTRWPAGSI